MLEEPKITAFGFRRIVCIPLLSVVSWFLLYSLIQSDPLVIKQRPSDFSASEIAARAPLLSSSARRTLLDYDETAPPQFEPPAKQPYELVEEPYLRLNPLVPVPVTPVSWQWMANTTLCIGVVDDSTNNAIPTYLQLCVGAGRQKFGFDSVFHLLLANGMCIDIYGGQTGGNNTVQQHNCHTGLNQKYILDSSFRLRTFLDFNVCATPWLKSDADTGLGLQVVIQNCTESDRQRFLPSHVRWDLATLNYPFAPYRYRLAPKFVKNLCLDTKYDRPLTQRAVVLQPCVFNKPSQMVTLDALQRLRFEGTTVCLAVASANTTEGTVVGVDECLDAPNHKWVHDSDHRLRPNHAPDMCLTLNTVPLNGAFTTMLQACSASPFQKWGLKD